MMPLEDFITLRNYLNDKIRNGEKRLFVGERNGFFFFEKNDVRFVIISGKTHHDFFDSYEAKVVNVGS